MPVPDSVYTFGATAPAGAIVTCGLTVAPVPANGMSCVFPFALTVIVALRAPIAAGLNLVVTLHVDDAGKEPPIWHVVVKGNSAAFVLTTLVTGTGVVPVFQSVIDSGVDVAPMPVVGNVRFGHVITNVDGVTAAGVVGVLLEQPVATSTVIRT
jgi:hypothetical protein